MSFNFGHVSFFPVRQEAGRMGTISHVFSPTPLCITPQTLIPTQRRVFRRTGVFLAVLFLLSSVMRASVLEVLFPQD